MRKHCETRDAMKSPCFLIQRNQERSRRWKLQTDIGKAKVKNSNKPYKHKYVPKTGLAILVRSGALRRLLLRPKIFS
jgi:hypothetical protein